MLKKLKVGPAFVRGCSFDGVVRNIQCVLAIYSGYVSFIRVGQMKYRRYTCPQKNQLSELKDAANKSTLPTKASAVEQARGVSPFVRRQSL